jgi:hypothetical protein
MAPHGLCSSVIPGAIMFMDAAHCSTFDLLNCITEILGTLHALDIKLAAAENSHVAGTWGKTGGERGRVAGPADIAVTLPCSSLKLERHEIATESPPQAALISAETVSLFSVYVWPSRESGVQERAVDGMACTASLVIRSIAS